MVEEATGDKVRRGGSEMAVEREEKGFFVPAGVPKHMPKLLLLSPIRLTGDRRRCKP